MSVEEMVSLVEANEDLAHFVGPIPEEKVREAEERLGVVFPASYREFLLRYGCGGIAALEFYGIGWGEPNAAPNVIFTTEAIRKSVALPDYLIDVYDSGFDEHCMIDTSQMENNEAPIIEWTPGLDESSQDLTVQFPDFSTFFVALVKESLRRKGRI